MENEIEAKDVAEQVTSSHREQRLVRLFEEVISGLKFERVAAATGKTVQELELSAKQQLADFVRRFPNVIASHGKGWTITRSDQGFGAWRVEMHYSIASSSGLLFESEKTVEAHKLGLIDDEGSPVYPPPVCYACHQKLPESSEPNA